MKSQTPPKPAWVTILVLGLVTPAFAEKWSGDHHAADAPPDMSGHARKTEMDLSLFGSDPDYGDQVYDPEVERLLYTKWEVPQSDPIVELGRRQYRAGSFERSSDVFGATNLTFGGVDSYFLGHDLKWFEEHEGKTVGGIPQTLIYGDFRLGTAYNDTGVTEKAVIATRLNLDVDIRFTASERIHAFFTPFNDGGNATRWEFAGGDNTNDEAVFNLEPSALFFEGDMARMLDGWSGGEYMTDADLPISFGLMPLFMQNGTWVFDAFTGFAITPWTAKNSQALDITNMDTTLFFGFDRVSTAAIPDDSDVNIYGITSYIEARESYIELGYGYVQGQNQFDDLSYHNLTAALTRRYFGKISNSVRAIWNVGQNPDPGRAKTADGLFLSVENSLITSNYHGFVPYFNMFAGFGTPQSLARDPGVGGVLFNTGILFESDNLTGYPTLNGTANNTYGFAVGLNMLNGLDFEATALDRTSYMDQGDHANTKQLVAELAAVFSDNPAIPDQYGLGLRYQRAISNSWLFRADAMYGIVVDSPDISGIRCEIRRKF